jgi:hypothetical protein
LDIFTASMDSLTVPIWFTCGYTARVCSGGAWVGGGEGERWVGGGWEGG